MYQIDRIVQITASIMEAPVESISKTTSKDSLDKWDSLNHLNLIMELESEFGISFSVEEIANIESLEDIERMISNKTNL